MCTEIEHKENKHCGTRTGYVSGCRCERCRAAHAARMWAERKIRESWDECLEIDVCDIYNDDLGVITGREIAQAIRHNQHEIKVNVLVRLWCKIRGFYQNKDGCVFKKN